MSLLQEMESSLNTIDSRLLTELDSENNAQLVRFLRKLGVKENTPDHIINHFILSRVSEGMDFTIVTPENILLWSRFLLRFGNLESCSNLRGKMPLLTVNKKVMFM